MIGNGCMIGPPAATGKGIQIIGRVPIIGERRIVDVVDGLIHRWRLTADANDVVGTLNLTNNGSVTFSESGASFNGSSQYLGLGTITMPAQSTITLFVRPTYWSSNACPFHVGDGDNFSSHGYLWDGTKSWFMHYPKRLLTSDLIWNSENFPSASWTLIGVHYNGSFTTGFHNTTKYTTGTIGNLYYDFTEISIGTLNTGSYGYWYAGLIADARIYNRALSDDDMAALYANGPNP